MLPGSYFLHIITSVLQFQYESKHQHFPLPELSCQLCIAMCFCSSGHHLVVCEKLWPPCCSPSNMKKHASWLIIITTSVCCLVQLGRRSRETLAAFFSLPPHQTLGGCQTQWVISRSVIVSFSRPFLSRKMSSSWTAKTFTFWDNLWFWHCAIQ